MCARRILLLVLFAMVLCASPLVRAQAPQPSAVLEQVRARGAEDARIGRAREDMQGVWLLFESEARAAGLTPNDVRTAYDAGYAEGQPPRPWWQQPGWLAALLLAIALVFRDFLKETLTQALTAAREYLYGRLAGHPLFRRTALGRYRAALIKRYSQLRVPFRPDRPLSLPDIYVPMRTRSNINAVPVDAEDVADANARVMISSPTFRLAFGIDLLLDRFSTHSSTRERGDVARIRRLIAKVLGAV